MNTQRMNATARLLAIVTVPPTKRVQCQNPGCGHGVYAAIHVVEEDSKIMVLGSTCFAKRYGGASALGLPAYQSGGSNGKQLTDEERLILIANTAELMARFKVEHEAAMAAAKEKLRALRERVTHPVAPYASYRSAPMDRSPVRPPSPQHPWPWQHHKNTSIALLRGRDGQCWVRVMHQNATHMLVPWPAPFDGWETALPVACGTPVLALQAYEVPNIVIALQALSRLGFSTPEVTRWPDILKMSPRLPNAN